MITNKVTPVFGSSPLQWGCQGLVWASKDKCFAFNIGAGTGGATGAMALPLLAKNEHFNLCLNVKDKSHHKNCLAML